MPTYEYQCTKCERIFEVFHSITAKPLRIVETDCERCTNRAPVRRLIGMGAGVIFKGSGFYETDYRSESYKAASKAEAESSSGKEGDKKKKDTDQGKAAKSSSKPKDASTPSHTKKSGAAESG